MSESTLALIAFLKLIWIGCFSYLYSLGGTEGYGKWLRRFVGSVWMGIGVYGFSSWSQDFHFWYLLYPILLCMSLHLGYGADELPRKIMRRFLCGLAVGVSSLPLVFPGHLFGLFGYGVFLSTINSIVLGAFNICKNARDEETLVACIGSIIPLFLI